jgi:hypothetical protein
VFTPTNSYVNTIARGSSLHIPIHEYRIAVSLAE